MSFIHSKNSWAATDDEAAYAAGSHADTAYTQQKLATLDGRAYPKTYGDGMFPYQKPIKDEIESQDDDIYGSIRADAGWESKEGSREEYVQDTYYWDKVLAQIALGQATTPPSYAIHWQDHIRAGTAADALRWESYGCFVKKLGFKIPVNDGTKESFPTWKITDACYSTKQDTGAGTTVDSIVKVGWLAIADNPIKTKASFTIGAQVVNNIEGELTIELLYDESKEAGDDGLKYPLFLGAKASFECKFRNNTQYRAFIANILTLHSAETRYTIKINTGLTSVFIQVTNMMVEDGNFAGIPEKGIKVNSLTLVTTSTSAITEESS